MHTITYIGGGLRTMGVHNVLEAAVYGKPVLFGPVYKKYTEAIGLAESGGGIPFTMKKRWSNVIRINQYTVTNKTDYKISCNAAANFVKSNKGATEKIIQFIQEKRLLTN